jgi:hypothetical protein
MGIKLKFVILVYSAVFLFACTSMQKIKRSDFYVSKDDFLKSYKTAFICGCINGASNNQLNRFFIETDDTGLFSEIETISYFTVKEADSIGRLYANRIEPINYIEAGYKKPVVAACIQFGFSKEIDRIAKQRYKKLIKGHKLEYIYE